MALHSLQEMQLKKSKMKDKKLVDAISAVILLEHYLQYRPTKNNE
jgi:RNase H-fold protein (predicted Holliday junction resolvase)